MQEPLTWGLEQWETASRGEARVAEGRRGVQAGDGIPCGWAVGSVEAKGKPQAERLLAGMEQVPN